MFERFRNANLTPPIRLVFFMWVAYTIQFSAGIDLGFLGVFPRKIEGLWGILFAPLIHGNIGHLVSNTFPILILGSTLYLFYPKIAGRIFLQCYFFTNLLVWIFARSFYHIGASGLVYAFAFFLIFLGLFRRDFKTLLIALVIGLSYGGLIYNVTYFNEDISWESHLLGAVVGVGNAYTIDKIQKII